MASVINTVLGFSFKNGVLGTVVGNLKDIKTAAVSVSAGLSDINKKLKNMASVQSIAALGIVMKNTAGSIKSAALGISKSYDKVVGFAERGDKIAKTSKLLGLGVKEYQAFASAAQHSGMSVEEMDVALKKLSVNLGKARSGDKQSLKMFNSILPKGTKLSDYKSTSSVIEAISDSYLKLESAEQKAFVSQGLFGESGTKMSELFKDGSAGIKQMLKDFADNGGGFDEKGAENAELFADELQKTKESINAISVSVMQDLFPTFIEMFKEIRAFVKKDGPEIKSVLKDYGNYIAEFVHNSLPKIAGWLRDFLDIVKSIGPKWIAISSVVITVAPVIVNMVGIFRAAYGVISTILGIVFKIVPLIVKAKDVVEAIVIGFKLASAVVGGAFYATVGGVLILFIEIVSIVKQFYDNWDMWCSFVNHELTDAVNDWVNMFVEDVKWLWNGFKSIFIDPFVVFFTSLPDMMSDLWQGFKDGISQIGSFIYNTFFGSIASAINGAKDLLKSLPLVGGLFTDSGAGANVGAQSQIATAVQQSYSTTTNRFAVDFQNMPQGVRVTPPDQGDFDWSRSYTLAGAV